MLTVSRAHQGNRKRLVGGRMRADGAQQLAQVTQFGAIQLHRCSSSSARRCTTYDNREILTPGKMPCPPLTARVKERHYTLRHCARSATRRRKARGMRLEDIRALCQPKFTHARPDLGPAALC
jgi:hypothetical protein